jgi:hypothetical protein
MNTQYPTKEEVLKEIQNFNPGYGYLKVLKRWREECYTKIWKDTPPQKKQLALQKLIRELEEEKKTLTPTERVLRFKWTNEWSYNTQTCEMTGDIDSLSIVSTLHEFGHHLYGTSELKACSFSVNLFSKCFPSVYDKLVWEGHMLKTLLK